MAPKEPTRQQLSSRLAYTQNTPSFLLKLQNRIAGIPDDEDDNADPDDEYAPDDGSGRPRIPQRPREALPERPVGDAGSAEEDDGDERPQVVVLRAGRHLTAREAENERRKGRGLAPIPDPELVERVDGSGDAPVVAAKAGTTSTSLSFSSSSKHSGRVTGKRKAVGNVEADVDDKAKRGKKKAKKADKTLLSFGDDA